MNGTRLYWVEGSWPGKVALAARPRGGDWLEDEITGWKRNGVDVVLSLLTNEEESDLDLANEASTVRTQGMGVPVAPNSRPTSPIFRDRGGGDPGRP